MLEFYEFTVPPDFARQKLPDLIIRDGDLASLVRIPISDPRIRMIAVIHDQWKRSGYVGQPGFWSWKVVRKYSDLEMSEAQWFKVHVKRILELSSHELGLVPQEPVDARRSGRLGVNLDKYGIDKIARNLSGDVIVSESFRNILEKYCSTEVEFRKIEHDGLESFYHVEINNEYAVIVPPTTVGDDPFSVQYVDRNDYKFAVSEIYFEMTEANSSKNLILTLQKSGYEMGDVKQARTLILSNFLLREIIALSSTELNFERSHWLI